MTYTTTIACLRPSSQEKFWTFELQDSIDNIPYESGADAYIKAKYIDTNKLLSLGFSGASYPHGLEKIVTREWASENDAMEYSSDEFLMPYFVKRDFYNETHGHVVRV